MIKCIYEFLCHNRNVLVYSKGKWTKRKEKRQKSSTNFELIEITYKNLINQMKNLTLQFMLIRAFFLSINNVCDKSWLNVSSVKYEHNIQEYHRFTNEINGRSLASTKSTHFL